MRIIRCGALALFLVCTTAFPAAATDDVWPLAAPANVLLGFGDSYESGSQSCTHRGVDLEAPSGSDVYACLSGTVVFAGSIPSDGGGTTRAVTIMLADGRRVSMLPFDCLSVAANQEVEAGDTLGSLALQGDDSSDGSHLHVGLREGEEYVDPLMLLQAPAAEQPEPAEEDLPEPAEVEPADEIPTGEVPTPPHEASNPVGSGGYDNAAAPSAWCPPVPTEADTAASADTGARPPISDHVFVPAESAIVAAESIAACSTRPADEKGYRHDGAAAAEAAHSSWWVSRRACARTGALNRVPSLPMLPLAAGAASIAAALCAASIHVAKPLASLLSPPGVSSLQTRSEGDRLLRLHILLRAFAFQSRGRAVQRR